MRFRNHEDNERLIKRLENAVRDNRISHAYIFEGDSCIDKKSFAESFAKGILCSDGRGDNCGRCSICSKIDHGNHEDLIYVGDGEGTIKDAQIIAMQERLRTKPFGDRNIVIMNGSDTMTQRAQNRLLKTLEEPQGDAVIMLLSENMENLIQTVQSRCVKYKINHFGTDGYDFMERNSCRDRRDGSAQGTVLQAEKCGRQAAQGEGKDGCIPRQYTDVLQEYARQERQRDITLQ